MSRPPEEPYFYPDLHDEKEQSATVRPPKTPRRSQARGISAGCYVVLGILVATLAAAGLVIFLVMSAFGPSQPQGPTSQRDISATAEAQTFATAQVHRQETRVAGYATGTAYA